MASNFLDAKKRLPFVGIGLGLRREIAAETFLHRLQIDWLELCPENYMETGGLAQEQLQSAADAFPLVSHGVNLSLGSIDPINLDYLKFIKSFLARIDSPWWSDHLCFTSYGGRYLHDLLPLPLTKEAMTHCIKRIKQVQSFVERPFLIENISYYLQMPGAEMEETQFISEIIEKADCGLLLDVNNIYVNSCNHGFDPKRYIDQLPLERVVQVHVAGHNLTNGKVIDTHGEAVVDPVFDLLSYLSERTKVKGVMLERDQNFPEFSDLIAELARIRSIMQKTNQHEEHAAVNGADIKQPAVRPRVA